jgi:hypothetical protein
MNFNRAEVVEVIKRDLAIVASGLACMAIGSLVGAAAKMNLVDDAESALAGYQTCSADLPYDNPDAPLPQECWGDVVYSHPQGDQSKAINFTHDAKDYKIDLHGEHQEQSWLNYEETSGYSQGPLSGYNL